MYKALIHDRGYNNWDYYEAITFKKIELNLNPAEHKLFTNDIFTCEDNKINIVHSSTRLGSIPGVLIIKGNKTYGRKNGKLLYKCVPDDMRIPSFLIPYEMKNIGFSKVFINLYVTFSYVEWNDKHPHGMLSQVIGPVDILDNFYEYQLYCKSLNASIQKFSKDTSKALKTRSHDAFIENICLKYPSIEDRTDKSKWFVFTIDPPKSLDFDDGFSFKLLENGIQQLSIYISNVTIWMDVLNLWDSFSRRISTIYLPDKKRPMLPTILSDCLCSLQENTTRIAFVMDIFMKTNDHDKMDIIDIKYSNCKIKVHKNFCYEEPELLSNFNYIQLVESTRSLSRTFKYINNIRNSHDVVCYLMILMNYHCANELLKNKNGIFRSTIMKKEFSVPEKIPEEAAKFIKIWNSACGQYIDAAELGEDDANRTRHELLEMDAYIHITSPIRRLVDLLNIIKFQENTGIIKLSEDSKKFYKKWIDELEYINITMRAIRKVQCDCSLLDLCSNNPETMEKIYEGYLFDKITRNDGLYQYIVFLPELKLASRMTQRENLNNFDKKNFKLYLFNDEENFKKKIRLQIID